MGLDIWANVTVGVEKKLIYKKFDKETEIEKKDKYGNKYTEVCITTFEKLGNKEFDTNGYDYYNYLEDSGIDYDDSKIIGFKVSETSSLRNDDDGYTELKQENINEAVKKASVFFKEIYVDMKLIKVYVVANAG